MAAPKPKTRTSRQAATPIPDRLRSIRTSLGLSQAQLGTALGLDESVAGIRINQYEQGVHTPLYSLIQRLADFAAIPEAFFYASDDQLAELIRAYGRLDSSGRKAACVAVLQLIPASSSEVDRG
ncbi:helix-turn-helix domain-containing protein [Hydrocarboniphaga effusa]|uniref:helix-turn-helix domain-containing protein n=1 Tax=Hydrocarboniphaga effusa TaxID=243629 RepID=UPI003CC7F963